MKYTFARSKILEGANNQIDKSLPIVTVKVQGAGEKFLKKAMGKLGSPGLGRHWILIHSD